MTVYANSTMIPALKKLWAACFGDDSSYVGYIFANLLTPEQILVTIGEAGEPISMICMQPFTLRFRDGEADGVYLFGIATSPEHQGKGLSTSLLEECHRLLEEQGKALSVLVPASESLFAFYGARGYELFAQVKKALYRRANLPEQSRPCNVSPAAFGSIAKMRDALYSGRAYVQWSSDYLRYIGGECRMLGGNVIMLSCGGRTGFAACYPVGERVVIKELAIVDRLLEDAIAGILSYFGKEECLVYLPADAQAGCSNKVLPYAMVRWYDKEKQLRMSDGGLPYIAHVLDD